MNTKILFACGAILLLFLFIGCTGLDKCGDDLICDDKETIEKCLSKNGCPPTACTNECGNGTCEYEQCKTLPCPCLETNETCPQDCTTKLPLPTNTFENSPFGAYGWSEWEYAPPADLNCAKENEVNIPLEKRFLCFAPPDYKTMEDVGIKWYDIVNPQIITHIDYKTGTYHLGYQYYSKASQVNTQPQLALPYLNGEHDIKQDLNEFYVNLNKATEYYTNLKYFLFGDEAGPGCSAGYFGPPKEYAVYTRIAYQAVKDARSKANFSFAGSGTCFNHLIDYCLYDKKLDCKPGTTATNWPGYYEEFLDELEYMERVEQGSLTYDNRYNYFLTQSEIGFLFRQDTYDKYFDGHHISNFDDSLQNTRSNTETIALVIKNLFSEYGYDNVFIWDTQTGIPAGPVNGGAQDNTESTQAQYVPRKWTISLVSGIEKSFWTGSGDFLWLNDGPNGYFAHLGLINAGLRDPQMYKVKKLSYYTYKLMIEKLEGSNWDTVQEIEVDENNIHVYRFMQNGKPTFVAWWNYWKEPNNKSKSVNLQLGLTGDVIITQAIPHFENGLLLQQSGEIYPKFFDIEIKTIKNRAGILNLQLNHNPVYIESN